MMINVFVIKSIDFIIPFASVTMFKLKKSATVIYFFSELSETCNNFFSFRSAFSFFKKFSVCNVKSANLVSLQVHDWI